MVGVLRHATTFNSTIDLTLNAEVFILCSSYAVRELDTNSFEKTHEQQEHSCVMLSEIQCC